MTEPVTFSQWLHSVDTPKPATLTNWCRTAWYARQPEVERLKAALANAVDLIARLRASTGREQEIRTALHDLARAVSGLVDATDTFYGQPNLEATYKAACAVLRETDPFYSSPYLGDLTAEEIFGPIEEDWSPKA